MAHIALPASLPSLSSYLLAGSLILGMFYGAAGDAQAQTSGPGGSTTSQGGAGAVPADRRDANPAGAARGRARPRNEPSEAYRESIRRTLELRRQRRANRGQGMGDSLPVGGIVPWPMPPALVIRHTPRVHDEIESFLGLLRK
jgi:hypothetical protein